MTHLPSTYANIPHKPNTIFWKEQRQKIRERESKVDRTPQKRGDFKCVFCGQTTSHQLQELYVCEKCLEQHSTEYVVMTLKKIKKGVTK